MGVVTTKATGISNRDATPRTISNSILTKSAVMEAVGTVEIASGDSTTSKYLLASVPSNARVSQVLVYSDDMGTATAADFGIYKSTQDGGTVVDADFFATAKSLSGGALDGDDITHENTSGFNADDAEKPLWQALGLSSDPHIWYDLVATLTTSADASGTLTAKLRYCL